MPLTSTTSRISAARTASLARDPGARRLADAVIAEVSVLTRADDPYYASVTTSSRKRLLRPLRDGAVLAGCLFTLYLFLVVAPAAGSFGFDAFAYWAVNGSDPYGTGVGGLGAFNYSPPIARLFDPFGSLEWRTFLWLWTSAPDRHA